MVCSFLETQRIKEMAAPCNYILHQVLILMSSMDALSPFCLQIYNAIIIYTGWKENGIGIRQGQTKASLHSHTCTMGKPTQIVDPARVQNPAGSGQTPSEAQLSQKEIRCKKKKKRQAAGEASAD